MSDNRPQNSSQEMKEFLFVLLFKYMTSSPHCPQSNGLAERMLKSVKQLLIKNKDPFIVLMSYRATLLPWCGLSPGGLLMGRQIRSRLLQIREEIIPLGLTCTLSENKMKATRTRKLKATTNITDPNH